MRRFRISIADLMAAVLFVAVAVAALTHPTLLWASLIHFLTLAILCLAALGTAFRVGDRRRFWAGFVVFGLVNYLLAFPLAGAGLPPLPVAMLVDDAIQMVHPPRPTGPYSSVMTLDPAGQVAFYNIAYSLSVMLVGYVGAVVSRAVFQGGADARSGEVR